MAYQITLECFNVRMRKYGEETDPYIQFDELKLRDRNGEENPTDFKQLFTYFIQSFNGTAVTSEDERKAIYLTEGSDPEKRRVVFSSMQRTIQGVIEGGTTGLGGRVASRLEPEDNKVEVEAADVTYLPFYFLLWLPKNSNRGILIIQGYSSISISSVFIKQLKAFIKRNTYKPTIILETGQLIEQEWIEETLREGLIKGIVFEQESAKTDAADKLVRQDYSLADQSIKLEIGKVNNNLGLQNALRTFLRGQGKGDIFSVFNQEGLASAGIDNVKDIAIDISYRGRNTRLRKSREFKFQSKYYFNEYEVPLNEKMHPNPEVINEICLELLEKLKNERSQAK